MRLLEPAPKWRPGEPLLPRGGFPASAAALEAGVRVFGRALERALQRRKALVALRRAVAQVLHAVDLPRRRRGGR